MGNNIKTLNIRNAMLVWSAMRRARNP